MDRLDDAAEFFKAFSPRDGRFYHWAARRTSRLQLLGLYSVTLYASIFEWRSTVDDSSTSCHRLEDNGANLFSGKTSGPYDAKRRLAYYSCTDPMFSAQKLTSIEAYALGTRIGCTDESAVPEGVCDGRLFAKLLETSKYEATHTVVLSELTEGTVYNIQIEAEDDEGNTFASDNYTFETLPVPKVVAAKVTQVAGQPTATVRVTWSTNTLVSSIVTYYPTNTPSLAQDQISLALKRSHQMVLRNLRDDQEYTIQIKGKDSAANEVQYQPISLRTALDFRAPEISNVAVESTVIGVGDEARAQVVVSWDTDEPATTQVEYGEGTSGTYSQKTQEDTNLTTNHVVTLSGLSPAKIYSIRALSEDKADNKAISQDSVVVTPRSTKSAFNIVIENLSKTFKFLEGM